MRFLLVFFLTLMGIGCTNGEDITDDPYIPDGLEEWTFSDTLGCRYGDEVGSHISNRHSTSQHI